MTAWSLETIAPGVRAGAIGLVKVWPSRPVNPTSAKARPEGQARLRAPGLVPETRTVCLPIKPGRRGGRRADGPRHWRELHDVEGSERRPEALVGAGQRR